MTECRDTRRSVCVRRIGCRGKPRHEAETLADRLDIDSDGDGGDDARKSFPPLPEPNLQATITSGRTALTFNWCGGCAAMLSQRCISLLLLLAYGIPAGLGPHWHHHSHGGCLVSSDCCCHGQILIRHERLSDSEKKADLEERARKAAGCHCDAHNEPQSDSETPDEENALNSSGVWATSTLSGSGPCAVCAFYSQVSPASSLTHFLNLTSSLGNVQPTAISTTVALELGFDARGPPGLL